MLLTTCYLLAPFLVGLKGEEAEDGLYEIPYEKLNLHTHGKILSGSRVKRACRNEGIDDINIEIIIVIKSPRNPPNSKNRYIPESFNETSLDNGTVQATLLPSLPAYHQTASDGSP